MIKLKRNVAPDQYLSDNRETNDKRNPSYTLSTMNNTFHGKVEVILNKNSYYFIQEKLFDIRFAYKHSNFSRVCLLVKMASKTRDKVYSAGRYGSVVVKERDWDTKGQGDEVWPGGLTSGCDFLSF